MSETASIRIRPAAPADTPALASLFLEVRLVTFPWLDPAGFHLTDFITQTDGEFVQLAEDGQGRPVGFISVWVASGFIHHLFVAPSRQRQGIGRQLLKSLEPWLPPPWRLKCQTANTSALGFYRHIGWLELSRANDGQGPYVLLEYDGPPPVPSPASNL